MDGNEIGGLGMNELEMVEGMGGMGVGVGVLWLVVRMEG